MWSKIFRNKPISLMPIFSHRVALFELIYQFENCYNFQYVVGLVRVELTIFTLQGYCPEPLDDSPINKNILPGLLFPASLHVYHIITSCIQLSDSISSISSDLMQITEAFLNLGYFHSTENGNRTRTAAWPQHFKCCMSTYSIISASCLNMSKIILIL